MGQKAGAASKIKKTRPALEGADARLMAAGMLGDAGAVQAALAEGADATAADEGGFTALMWAARYEHPLAVAALLAASDLAQKEDLGRDALGVARGAGLDSQGARMIEAYALARAELAEMASESSIAPKSKARSFRL